jgi:exportin-2 (importin alpha re-exporter)
MWTDRDETGAMRVIITARQTLTPVYEGILSRIVNILGEISKNPSNPKFNQYCFESISALIRSVGKCISSQTS